MQRLLFEGDPNLRFNVDPDGSISTSDDFLPSHVQEYESLIAQGFGNIGAGRDASFKLIERHTDVLRADSERHSLLSLEPRQRLRFKRQGDLVIYKLPLAEVDFPIQEIHTGASQKAGHKFAGRTRYRY